MKRGCSVVPVAFENTDILLLQVFSPAELKLNVVKDFKKLEELAVAQNVSILVTGQTLADETKYGINLILMKPLIAYSQKQIQDQLKWYRGLVTN